jgi:hypothetical protein
MRPAFKSQRRKKEKSTKITVAVEEGMKEKFHKGDKQKKNLRMWIFMPGCLSSNH